MLKKILLVCSSGMSTSLLAKSMQKAADSDGYMAKIESASIVALDDRVSEIDAVLLGPQVGYRFDSLKEIADNAGKPIKILPAEIYAAMDGSAALKIAKKIMDNYRNEYDEFSECKSL